MRHDVPLGLWQVVFERLAGKSGDGLEAACAAWSAHRSKFDFYVQRANNATTSAAV